MLQNISVFVYGNEIVYVNENVNVNDYEYVNENVNDFYFCYWQTLKHVLSYKHINKKAFAGLKSKNDLQNSNRKLTAKIENEKWAAKFKSKMWDRRKKWDFIMMTKDFGCCLF